MSTANESSRIWPRLRSLFKAQEWALAAGILVVLLVIYALDKDGAFYQSYSLQTLLHRVALFGVLSVGAAVVIIAGGIDLSTGAVVSLASVVSAKLLTEWLRTASSPPPSIALIALAIGLTVLMGASVGLGHALMINFLRLPPFIATLATMAGLRSLATVLCQNKTITVPFPAYRALGKEQWISLCIFAGVAVFMSILMGCTVLGRHLFALGGNETAARLCGLRTRRLKAFAYATAGTLSALGGVLFTGFSGQGDSRMGNAYELDGHHRRGRRRLQSCGGSRINPGHSARPAPDTDRVERHRHPHPQRYRQHPDRGPRAGHGRAGGRRVQSAFPGWAELNGQRAEISGPLDTVTVSHHKSLITVFFKRKAVRRVAYGLTAIQVVVAYGVAGYLCMGWTFIDALYQVVITVSGVGFNEVEPMLSTGSRVFTMSVIALGMLTVAFTLGSFVQFLTESQFIDYIGRHRMTKNIQTLKDHIIIAGYGHLGSLICDELAARDKGFVLIDQSHRSRGRGRSPRLPGRHW